MEVNKIFEDFTNEPKVSVIEKTVRKIVTEDIIEYLKQRYDTVRRVGNDEVGVVVGVASDTDGYSSDVVVTLKATAKPWYDKQCAKRSIEKYDLNEAGDAYEMNVKAQRVPKK